MGSIGLDPAQQVLEGSLFILLVAIIGGWVLYQFKTMRLLFCLAVFLFSSAVLGYAFSHLNPNDLNQHVYLFLTALCYGFSACYLAKCHFFTPIIWLMNLAYLLVALFLTLQTVFSMTYEEEILEKLFALSVDIAILLYVPISVMILLPGFLKARHNNDQWI